MEVRIRVRMKIEVIFHIHSVRYISSCVTLTVTVFITQVSHPKSLASYLGLQVFSTLSCTL